MNPEWYYTADGAQHGPVTAADLKKLARAGTIHPEDLIWKTGTPNWVPAKSVKGLFATPGTKTDAVKPETPVENLEDSATELIEDLPAKKKPDNRLADRLSEIQRKPIKEKTPEPDDEEPEERPKRSSRIRDEEDEEPEERPKRSSRIRDKEDEEPEERPKRASRSRDDDDDDEDDDRPRKRRQRRDDDDDDDDDRRSRSRSRRRYEEDDEDDDDFDERRPSRRRQRNRNRLKPGAGLGMASMICGTLSLVSTGSSCFLGAVCALGLVGFGISGILALVAVCLGFPALKTEGKGFGIAGLITGFLGLIPVLLAIVGVITGFAVAGAGGLAR